MKTSKLLFCLKFLNDILLAILYSPSVSCVPRTHVVKTFVDPMGDFSTLNNHFVVHKETGILYLGSVNKIYQLDPDLHLLAVNKNGPNEDSPECSGYRDCPPKVRTTLTNNINKALVIDYSLGNLIACGSLYQGTCSRISLANISTLESEYFSEPIVANDETSSTVAFIAPGPPSTPTVLYLGVTYTGNSPYRHEVPAVSSRSLNPRDNFQILQASASSGTKIHISLRDSYPIKYVYGFSSGFSYFLTTQKKEVGYTSPYISKLVRVCQNDFNYYSYTEVPIDCVSETTGIKFDLVQAAFVAKPGRDLASKLDVKHQDDVLFALFSRAESPGSSNAGNDSALCVYSLKDIRQKFVENIKLCFQGKGNRGLGFISMNAPCVSTKLKIFEEDFCGMDINTPLGGENPVLALSVVNFTVQLTSVAATSRGNHTIVFLGTKSGHLKKVVVESGKEGKEYDDLDIDSGSRVLPDMFFDPQKPYIYVMTERKLSKVLTHNCSEYSTCQNCVDPGDPYCGWCSVQNKCTSRNNCPNRSNQSELSVYWISYKSGQCTRITMVTPNQLQSSTATTLTINIDHLHFRSGEFWCVFRFASDKTIKTHANLTTNGVSCYTPPTSDLPPISPRQHNFTAALSVRISQDGSTHNDFTATDFIFFDCTTYTTCTSCVTSAFPCDWCVDKHRCTHETAENCPNDILVTGLKRVGPSIRSGPNFCPCINVTNGSHEILVPYGTQKRIRVRVNNILHQMIVQTRFSCRFNIEGRVIPTHAQLVEGTIYCDSIIFNYKSPAPNIAVPFAVVWGGGETKSLDNPDNIHILVYRCPAMADTCGMCHVMDEKYRCGWCQSIKSCEVREQCNYGTNAWLHRSRTCPNPEIHSFFPTTGPWEGGTNVTIEGINLGKTVDDIYSGVTVAGILCEPYLLLYSKTRKIVCHLKGPGNNEPLAGPIIIRVGAFRAESTNIYRFVDPIIQSITPTMGPMNGGTRLTIYGEHLNAGSVIKAFVGTIPCQIILKEDYRIECHTGSFKRKTDLQFTLKFDQGERVFEPGFSYVDNPVIMFDKDKPIRGIPAGGLSVRVNGKHFHVIQQSNMYVLFNGSKYTSACDISSNNSMVCYTPNLNKGPFFYELNRSTTYIKLQYGFLLDTIDYPAFNILEYDHPFILFPNPEFDRFKDDVKLYTSDYLTINGRYLNYAAEETEFQVLIGDATCNVTSVSKTQLTCRPPTTQPAEIDDENKIDMTKLPRVKVKIGQRLTYVIGRILYAHINNDTNWVLKKQQVIITAVILLVIFIGLSIVVAHFLRKKYHQTYLLKSEIDEFFIGSQSVDNDDQIEINLAHKSAYDKDRYEISLDSFVINESSILGSGEFGIVCRGTVLRSSEEKVVAVKTVNPQNSHKTAIKGLLSEIKLLAFIGQHPNIIELIGANTSDLESGKVFIFLELCELGSLLKYLRKMRPRVNSQEQSESVNENMGHGHLYVNQNIEMNWLRKPNLDVSLSQDLKRWSMEICSAMAFLATKHVVHADLATRNILLNLDKKAKICDFGLSRRMYNYANYVKQQQEPLPWKWMSPESLRLLQFNEKSDVWAYGVTLWELYTLGDTPYSGLSWDMNFAALLENGFRLNEPVYNQYGVYEIMKKCWTTNPSGRPVFADIVELLNR